MAKSKPKTNAARLLEAAKIPFELIEYTVDENDLAAQHVADELGEDINRVFKTLVLRGERHGLFVCVVPGNCEVDLKKAAARRYSVWVRPHRAASCSSLAFSSSVSLIFSLTFSSFALKLIPPF